MEPSASTSLFALILAFAGIACVPHRDIPAKDVPSLTKLSEVMDVQATVADPQFSKIGQAAYTDADFTAFADVSERIQATSTKAKDFTKGPGFDKLADQLHEQAVALGAASASKNAKAASDTLASMKATCKECHKAFR